MINIYKGVRRIIAIDLESLIEMMYFDNIAESLPDEGIYLN